MVGFVLTGHGDFATGVASALEMIAGPQEHFEVVPFHEGEEGEFPGKLTEALERASADGDGALAFCDLLGGTPFNQTMILAKRSKSSRARTCRCCSRSSPSAAMLRRSTSFLLRRWRRARPASSIRRSMSMSRMEKTTETACNPAFIESSAACAIEGEGIKHG